MDTMKDYLPVVAVIASGAGTVMFWLIKRLFKSIDQSMDELKRAVGSSVDRINVLDQRLAAAERDIARNRESLDKAHFRIRSLASGDKDASCRQ